MIKMADATGLDILLILAEILGFTTIWSTFWNIGAYAISLIIVLSIRLDDKSRNVVITATAPFLAIYAWVFLDNPVFISLQILIFVSGILVLAKIPPPFPKILTLAAAAGAYALLFKLGAIKFSIKSFEDFLIFAGPVGLICCAFALTTFPKNFGFLLFAIGGALLSGYALAAKAWVFFGLNTIFALVNMREYVLKTAERDSHAENKWLA